MHIEKNLNLDGTELPVFYPYLFCWNLMRPIWVSCCIVVM